MRATSTDNVHHSLIMLFAGLATSMPIVYAHSPECYAAAPQRSATAPKSADSQGQLIRAPHGTWDITLPGNIRIRLVGVTAGPSAVGAWWGPDGAALLQSPYPQETAAETSLRPAEYALYGGKPGEHPIYFAFEIMQPDSADVQVINANTLEPTTHGRFLQTRARCLAFAPSARVRGTATLSIATMPWETIARTNASGGHFTGIDRQGTKYDFRLTARVIPIRVDSTPSGDVIRVEWSGTFAGTNPWQIEVTDRKGQKMQQVVGGETAATDNYHMEFRPHGIDSPVLDTIKEIRVQVRPRQKIIFDDVALQRVTKKVAK